MRYAGTPRVYQLWTFWASVPQNFAKPVVEMFAASRSALNLGPLVFFLINTESTAVLEQFE